MPIKILVVDDEPNIIKLVQSRLKANGYQVVSASNGLEGIEKAKKEKPDLILMDITMPKMDGKEALASLKKDSQTKDIPVIMLTARQDIDDIVACMSDIGAADYIVKPFIAGEFLKKINTTLSPDKKVPESSCTDELMDKVEKRIKKALDDKEK